MIALAVARRMVIEPMRESTPSQSSSESEEEDMDDYSNIELSSSDEGKRPTENSDEIAIEQRITRELAEEHVLIRCELEQRQEEAHARTQTDPEARLELIRSVDYKETRYQRIHAEEMNKVNWPRPETIVAGIEESERGKLQKELEQVAGDIKALNERCVVLGDQLTNWKVNQSLRKLGFSAQTSPYCKVGDVMSEQDLRDGAVDADANCRSLTSATKKILTVCSAACDEDDQVESEVSKKAAQFKQTTKIVSMSATLKRKRKSFESSTEECQDREESHNLAKLSQTSNQCNLERRAKQIAEENIRLLSEHEADMTKEDDADDQSSPNRSPSNKSIEKTDESPFLDASNTSQKVVRSLQALGKTVKSPSRQKLMTARKTVKIKTVTPEGYVPTINVPTQGIRKIIAVPSQLTSHDGTNMSRVLYKIREKRKFDEPPPVATQLIKPTNFLGHDQRLSPEDILLLKEVDTPELAGEDWLKALGIADKDQLQYELSRYRPMPLHNNSNERTRLEYEGSEVHAALLIKNNPVPLVFGRKSYASGCLDALEMGDLHAYCVRCQKAHNNKEKMLPCHDSSRNCEVCQTLPDRVRRARVAKYDDLKNDETLPFKKRAHLKAHMTNQLQLNAESIKAIKDELNDLGIAPPKDGEERCAVSKILKFTSKCMSKREQMAQPGTTYYTLQMNLETIQDKNRGTSSADKLLYKAKDVLSSTFTEMSAQTCRELNELERPLLPAPNTQPSVESDKTAHEDSKMTITPASQTADQVQKRPRLLGQVITVGTTQGVPASLTATSPATEPIDQMPRGLEGDVKTGMINNLLKRIKTEPDDEQPKRSRRVTEPIIINSSEEDEPTKSTVHVVIEGKDDKTKQLTRNSKSPATVERSHDSTMIPDKEPGAEDANQVTEGAVSNDVMNLNNNAVRQNTTPTEPYDGTRSDMPVRLKSIMPKIINIAPEVIQHTSAQVGTNSNHLITQHHQQIQSVREKAMQTNPSARRYLIDPSGREIDVGEIPLLLNDRHRASSPNTFTLAENGRYVIGHDRHRLTDILRETESAPETENELTAPIWIVATNKSMTRSRQTLTLPRTMGEVPSEPTARVVSSSIGVEPNEAVPGIQITSRRADFDKQTIITTANIGKERTWQTNSNVTHMQYTKTFSIIRRVKKDEQHRGVEKN